MTYRWAACSWVLASSQIVLLIWHTGVQSEVGWRLQRIDWTCATNFYKWNTFSKFCCVIEWHWNHEFNVWETFISLQNVYNYRKQKNTYMTCEHWEMASKFLLKQESTISKSFLFIKDCKQFVSTVIGHLCKMNKVMLKR